MNGLNAPQTSAVLHPQGPLLIFAGAGSGKTRTITFRIAHLLAEHRVPPYRILAVTFTNKAAREMRDRLQALVGEEIARDLQIGTFHGSCARILRRYAREAGLAENFVIYDDSDQKAVLARIIKELDIDDRRYPPKQVLARISALKREGQDPGEARLDEGFDETLSMLAREYEAALKRSSAVDFDDLLLYVLRMVEAPDNPGGLALRQKFSHVLVDEFQDTNMVQYRIVRALSAQHRNLCVVGDDDQSIYRWRGADVRIIRGFRSDFPETLVVKLEQNYRSSQNIVKAALGVISRAQDREPKELWTAESPGEKVVVRGCQDERAEALFVMDGIQKARLKGVDLKELAVFYRTHAQSRVLEEALRGAGLPYQIVGGMKFFERAEVKDMLSYLRLVHNPDSDTDFLRVVNVPARGIGDKTVEKLLEVAAENTQSLSLALASALTDGSLGAAAKKLSGFHQLLTDLKDAATKLGPADLLERILAETGYKKNLEKDDSAESDARLENLAELVGSLREYEDEAPETGEDPTLSGYLERVALVAAPDTLEDSSKVSLMTVHSSKGLEFEQVWLTGMEEETFPYRGMDGEDPEQLDEERRLAYVAITRARKQLFISHASSRFLFGKTKYLAPSRFLSDLPEEVVKREGQANSRPAWLGGEDSSRSAGSSAFGFRRSGGAESSASPFQGGGSRGRGAESGEASSSGSWRGGYTPGGQNRSYGHEASPGGRATAAKLELKPGQRIVERDEFDQSSDEGESVVIRPGQKVKHSRFGVGVVERVEPGAQPTVVARFPGYGPKRILAEFLKFDI